MVASDGVSRTIHKYFNKLTNKLVMEIRLHFEDVKRKRTKSNHFRLMVNSGLGSIDIFGLSRDNIMYN